MKSEANILEGMTKPLPRVRKYAKAVETTLCYLLVFVITPCFFIFEMTIVRPIIVKIYKFGTIKQTLHIICPTFCFTNIAGNMIFSILTDTKVSLQLPKESDGYCEQCRINRPAKAWHCQTCNACILRRDHHCFFFSRCIGLRNQRYYVTYLGYIFISMIYSLYYNYYYVLTKFDGEGVYLSAFRIINPFLRYMIPEPLGFRDLYVLFLFLNTGLVFWSGGLFYFHMKNALRGVTAHEYRERCSVDWSVIKTNLVKVFGLNWYWAMITPFVDSPLPEIIDDYKRE